MRPAWLILAAFALGGSGCGSSSSADTLQSRPAPANLSKALIHADELHVLPGAPLDSFVQRPIDQAQLTVDPDPRGPCGAKASAVSLRKGALRAFSSQAGVTVIQWINRLPPGRAADVIDAEVADLHPGCADFRTTTASGAKQKVHFIGAVPLPASLADQRFAAMSLLGTGPDAVGAARIELRREDCLMLVISFSTKRPSRAFVSALAETAAGHLDAVPRSSCRN